MAEAPPRPVAIVTGAARGLGRAFVDGLGARGYQTVACDVEPSVAELGGLALQADVRVPADVRRVVDAALERHGRIDVLINNAGILRQVFFDEGDEDLLDELWTVNVKAPFRLIRHALPHLSETGGGRIINVGSTDAKRYRAGVSVGYAMSKHALMAMSHAAKAAGWEHGVRVTALCPGAVDTPMIQSIPGVTPVDERIQPTDLAAIVAFLLGLPNNASVPELVVNTRLESGL